MRRALMVLWRLAAVALLILLALALIDGQEALARLGAIRPGWAALAVVLLSAQIVLSALRWRHTAARLGQDIAPGRAVREYYLAVLANSVLPGGVLGDAGRAIRARQGAGLATAATAVVVERAAGQVALLALLLVGLLLWPGGGTFALAGLAAFAATALALRLGPPPLDRAGRVLARVWAAEGAWRVQGVLSLVIVAANVGAFAACSAAIGAPLPLGAVPVVIPLTLAAMLLPVGLGGWGVREGAAALLWPLAGASAEAGLAASIVFGLACLAAALPGAAMMCLKAEADEAPRAPASHLVDADRARAAAGRGWGRRPSGEAAGPN